MIEPSLILHHSSSSPSFLYATTNTVSKLNLRPSPSKPSELPLCNHRFRVRAVRDKTKPVEPPPSAEDVTKKFGLEAGLWKIFSTKEDEGEVKKSKGEQAKELLAKYGGAYLATSITLSAISFAICYALVTSGVDVPALLNKVGIATDETGEKVGTFALAYAAHKAASPIRFPPTVALTPIVAGWIGQKVDKDD